MIANECNTVSSSVNHIETHSPKPRLDWVNDWDKLRELTDQEALLVRNDCVGVEKSIRVLSLLCFIVMIPLVLCSFGCLTMFIVAICAPDNSLVPNWFFSQDRQDWFFLLFAFFFGFLSLLSGGIGLGLKRLKDEARIVLAATLGLILAIQSIYALALLFDTFWNEQVPIYRLFVRLACACFLVFWTFRTMFWLQSEKARMVFYYEYRRTMNRTPHVKTLPSMVSFGLIIVLLISLIFGSIR